MIGPPPEQPPDEPAPGPRHKYLHAIRRISAPVSGILFFLLYITFLARLDIDNLNSLPGGWKLIALALILALIAVVASNPQPLRDRASTLRAWLASHPALIILTLITLGGFGLRIFGISNNLPYLNHPDEPPIADNALKILQTGDYNPHYFTYPSLYTYMQAALYVIRFFSLVSSGTLTRLDQMTTPDYYLWGRLLTALLGTLTIPVVYLAARRLYSSLVALLAALFIAANSVHLANSQFITSDVPATFFTALALLAIVHLLPLQDQQLKTHNSKLITPYLLAGMAIGLAAGTKYNCALVIIPFLLAHAFVTADSPHANKLAAYFDRRFWSALASMLAVFFLTTPFAIFDLPHFLADIGTLINHYRTGHPGFEGDSNWLFYASTFLQTDPLPTLLTLVGILIAFTLRRRSDLLILSFPLIYYFFMSGYRVNFIRNMLPIIPFTSILAAEALAVLTTALTRRIQPSKIQNPKPKIRSQYITHNSKLIIPVLAALALLAILPAAVDALRRDYRNTQPDNRIRAAQWLDTNTRQSAKLWMEPLTPILTPNRYLATQGPHVTDHPLDWYIANRYEYLVLSSNNYKAFTYDNPAQNPPLRDAYLRFFDQNIPNLVASFQTNPVDHPGPTILIYRTPYTLPRTVADVHPQHLTPALFHEEGPNNGIAQLIGVDFPDTATPGLPFPILLYWTSNPPLHDNYTVFVHLVDPSGNRPTQRDIGPRSNTYPTSRWQPDEVVLDESPLDLPADLPAGTYTLRVGLYLQSNFKSLPVSPSDRFGLPPNSGTDYITLGQVTIQPARP